jgi:hypothetical protein
VRVKADSQVLLDDTITGYTTNIPVRNNITLYKRTAHFALLPVWVYQYTFRGKEYLYYVNGQTGKVIGSTPTDRGRAVLYTGTVFALVLLAGELINMIMGVL